MDKNAIAVKAAGHLRQYAVEMGFAVEGGNAYRAGPPLAVRDLAGHVSYWLVPVIENRRMVAFMALARDGMLVAYGRYPGGGMPREYLDAKAAANALRSAFGGAVREMGPPVLIHDGPPQRVAWAARATAGEDDQTVLLFWSFGSSYRRDAADGVPAALL